MTRTKLIPWLAIPVLLLASPALPVATAATLESSMEDGLIYLPKEALPAWLTQEAAQTSLQTSMTPGVVTLSPFGVPDGGVSNRNGFVAVRFDPPFDPPYTITGISFPSLTGNQIASRPAVFRSVRIMGMHPTTGLPDKSQQLFRQNRFLGSSVGGTNTIPLSIPVSEAGKTFFAVFDFPAFTTGILDSFPFMLSDLSFHGRGLFATTFATDSNAAIRTVPAPYPGTLTGSALLMDQNANASMTFALSSQAPLNSPTNLGLNSRATQVEFTFDNPANVLADGTAAPNNHLDFTELVRRDSHVWTTIGAGGAGSNKVTLGSLPGSGLQFWGVRSVAKSGKRSAVSHVTVSGPGTVVAALGPLGEDADEPNGRASESEATALSVPVIDRPGTLWPAGDQDYFWFLARKDDVISISVTPNGNDFRNEMVPLVHLYDNSGDLVGTGVGTPGGAASLVYTAAGSGNSLKRYIAQVADKNRSLLDPTSAPRVLVAPGYKLSVDVSTPATMSQFGAGDQPIAGLLNPDEFGFALVGANPVQSEASFGYVIPRGRAAGVPVSLRIYDARGRLVSTLVNDTKSAGTHYASWSGLNRRGHRAGAGAYFARLEAGSYSRAVRVELLK